MDRCVKRAKTFVSETHPATEQMAPGRVLQNPCSESTSQFAACPWVVRRSGHGGDWGDETAVGYARVSTAEQNSDLQVDALRKAGCAKVFVDQASGGLCRFRVA
jgi:hypothetical protein